MLDRQIRAVEQGVVLAQYQAEFFACRRPKARRQPDGALRAYPELIAQYGFIAVTGVYTAIVEIAQDVEQAVIGRDILHARVAQLINETRPDLRANTQIPNGVQVAIHVAVGCGHDQCAGIGVNRIAESHDLLTLRRAQHGSGDDVDLASQEGRQQR